MDFDDSIGRLICPKRNGSWRPPLARSLKGVWPALLDHGRRIIFASDVDSWSMAAKAIAPSASRAPRTSAELTSCECRDVRVKGVPAIATLDSGLSCRVVGSAGEEIKTDM